ncbi:acetyl-CoA C-acyltransferase family protein [Pseudomonas aeruginosa]|jgi:acetyl-CoA C-acetyltransferase|uniref:Acetyl-CoA C-acyltransferase family protein n=1 Tax=Ectopseudomonas toyotomiensis TaxID=554344 RepID=A0AA42LE29_9GAMM|nr:MULTISPECIES: acetyl-CoA C-acyltransferase family protein [Pseudomonadaceae]RRU92583.1 acetyl-CoA C-acyltransferase [Stutzerimonas xanthomarina]KSE28039.1 acetyl-CoA acetyltransferase [Pseudomonas aeruginosa]KSG99939.1 acetyl-CoA acetyltransferase [Pseudomonas aeruginosa]KSS49678.1 acetyl-CoA acetyltransferase [Pseudomonas aeruginosa]MBA1263155.1 acetyl-CoA C-acyltransferase family protein [Stutzerimonas stutzeri]
MSEHEVVIVSGVRTAIGDFGGSLKDLPPTELGTLVTKEAMLRAGVSGTEVDHVIFGNVIHSEARDMYLSRVVAIQAGIAQQAPALTLNRLCGSGLQALISAAQGILLGDSKVAVAGGAESMSRAPYSSSSNRFGSRMGDAKLADMLTGALTDPFHGVHMGITAENVAKSHGISREEQDALALESHRRAARAIEQGHFREQILPITLKGRVQVRFDTDEHVRRDAAPEDFSRLKPVFDREAGSVTAGNASGLNDGAAALVLMERKTAEQRGLKPMARLLSYGHAGVDPLHMGIGPVPASRLALARAGLEVSDLDVIEANEAFAAQACAVSRELGLDPARVNPNGSGISLGHPIGATGAIIAIKAIYELQRTGGRYALVTMCIGGGQGIAVVLERL